MLLFRLRIIQDMLLFFLLSTDSYILFQVYNAAQRERERGRERERKRGRERERKHPLVNYFFFLFTLGIMLVSVIKTCSPDCLEVSSLSIFK